MSSAVRIFLSFGVTQAVAICVQASGARIVVNCAAVSGHEKAGLHLDAAPRKDAGSAIRT